MLSAKKIVFTVALAVVGVVLLVSQGAWSNAEAKSAKQWLLAGWHVPVGYVLGFAAMFALLGFTPRALPKHAPTASPAPAQAPADGR